MWYKRNKVIVETYSQEKHLIELLSRSFDVQFFPLEIFGFVVFEILVVCETFGLSKLGICSLNSEDLSVFLFIGKVGVFAP